MPGPDWGRISKAVRSRLGVAWRTTPGGTKALALALVLFAIDVATKAWVAHAYLVGERGELFSTLSVYRVNNPGISLGLFDLLGWIDNGVRFPPLLLAASAVLVSWRVLVWVRRWPALWFPAALLIGGAAGNLLELLYRGYATDFIYLSGLRASANLADFFLLSGILLMLVVQVRIARPPRATPLAGSKSAT
jgi:signal peptidase II